MRVFIPNSIFKPSKEISSIDDIITYSLMSSFIYSKDVILANLNTESLSKRLGINYNADAWEKYLKNNCLCFNMPEECRIYFPIIKTKASSDGVTGNTLIKINELYSIYIYDLQTFTKTIKRFANVIEQKIKCFNITDSSCQEKNFLSSNQAKKEFENLLNSTVVGLNKLHQEKTTYSLYNSAGKLLNFTKNDINSESVKNTTFANVDKTLKPVVYIYNNIYTIINKYKDLSSINKDLSSISNKDIYIPRAKNAKKYRTKILHRTLPPCPEAKELAAYLKQALFNSGAEFVDSNWLKANTSTARRLLKKTSLHNWKQVIDFTFNDPWLSKHRCFNLKEIEMNYTKWAVNQRDSSYESEEEKLRSQKILDKLRKMGKLS